MQNTRFEVFENNLDGKWDFNLFDLVFYDRFRFSLPLIYYAIKTKNANLLTLEYF